MSTSIAPVEHRVRVALAPADAFDLFTRQIARWWPFRGHSCFGDEAVDVVFEALPGGGTEVHVHHSGWEVRGAQAAEKRDQYDGGWPATLAAFAALAGANPTRRMS